MRGGEGPTGSCSVFNLAALVGGGLLSISADELRPARLKSGDQRKQRRAGVVSKWVSAPAHFISAQVEALPLVPWRARRTLFIRGAGMQPG